MFRLLASVVMVACIALAATSVRARDSAEATGSVSGKIVDPGGQPVRGAAVAIHLGLTARYLGQTASAPDGTFTITNIPRGTFTLTASQGRAGSSKTIHIEADKNTDAGTLTLRPQKTTCGA